MIDLHMHSVFSDGTYTPEELVDEAVSIGLKAIALTDHDTVDGVKRFLRAASERAVEGIPGVEITTHYRHGTMHILGYFVDHLDAVLLDHLRWIREGRRTRNEEVLHRLIGLGMHLSMRDVQRHAGTAEVSRMHFAAAMVDKGYSATNKQAFEQWLRRGRPAYAEPRRLSPEDTIGLILDSGGVPVVAHPFTLDLTFPELRKQLAVLRYEGLVGIEAYYTEHATDLKMEYLKLARDLDLIPTGGSDFHGGQSPGVKLGMGFGELEVPDDLVDRLRAACPA